MGTPDRVSRETIDIETSGGTVSIRMMGAERVSLHIRGDAAANYQWDAREKGGTWIQNVGPEYSGSADYDDVMESGVQELRIRCSSGTGTAGDQADVLVSAGG